ncbi:MAG: hypothetical protein ACRELB_26995, partial [Polyangiaceae bacterium]
MDEFPDEPEGSVRTPRAVDVDREEVPPGQRPLDELVLLLVTGTPKAWVRDAHRLVPGSEGIVQAQELR